MKTFTWREMQEYWRSHDARWRGLDYARDPGGLTNVCHPGAPLWLNRHFARFQRRVYARLLASVPVPAAGGRALDVGCGAGRWCRVLQDRGYAVTGLDLQPGLIADNQARMPGMTFVCAPVQDYRAAAPFDLVSSVTVIQHNPPEEQEAVLRALRGLLRPGGHALVLENVRDAAPSVFPRTAAGWTEAFLRAGFAPVARLPYDYSPFLRLHWALFTLLRGGRAVDETGDAGAYMAPKGGPLRAALRGVNDVARLAAAGLDALAEPLCMAARLGPAPAHCGFVFRRHD